MANKIKVVITNDQSAVKIPKGMRMLIRRCCTAVLTMEELEYRYDTQLLIEGEDLDEDEIERLAAHQTKECPFYKDGDEYKTVRHQM